MTTMAMAGTEEVGRVALERTRYRFGPLERRGLIAGWRGGQIASVAGGLVIAVLVLRSRPSAASVAVALVVVVGGVALACWPVAGRTGEEWLPTVVRWGSSGLSNARHHRSSTPAAGRCVGPDGVRCFAAGTQRRAARTSKGAPCAIVNARAAKRSVLGGLSILSARGEPGAAAIGVVHDPMARTYTAVVAVRGHSFALLGPEDKERRVGGWASVLASFARERSAVHRIQWIASVLPDDGRAVRGYLDGRAVLPDGSAARRSYSNLLAGAGVRTCRHEVMLAIQVCAGGASSRAVRASGGGDVGACAVLLREVAALCRQLSDADVVVERTLGPRALASAVRRTGESGPLAADPIPDEEHGAAAGGGVPPCAAGWPWPMATEMEWGCFRTDATWHATYWIAEWPRVDVGPDFLGPLLLGPVRRSVSVVMEPLSPSRAVRQVEQARTADLADSELRRRGGFLVTARRSREEALVTRREEELADGHASFRFSGYITVTAPSRDLMDEACEATEQAAGQCHLELRRLFGEQDRAFTCTLPLCRGLS